MDISAATITEERITEFCRRWKIRELALFGSVLRDDFDDSSDVDFLVTFVDNADWGLLDHVQMEHELEKLLEREVDLVTKRAVEQSQNWIRRQEILGTAQVFYAAPGAIHVSG